VTTVPGGAPQDGCAPFTVVVPTVGRDTLARLLDALARQAFAPDRLVLVDDRRCPGDDLIDRLPAPMRDATMVVRSGGRGPAAARNLGWRSTETEWVVFLDDDVEPTPDWSTALAHDLALHADAVQARIEVPLPTDRRPTDSERNVARLADAPWITADLAVRARVLEATGGFDERFPRAYREDTDFALRAAAAGFRFARGRRVTHHPVRREAWWASISRQRGNADDALLSALHGRDALTPGRRSRHVATVLPLVAATLAGRSTRWRSALIGVWFGATAEFFVARLRSGHRAPGEISALAVTSAVIPPVAVWHWCAGRWRWRALGPADRWRPAPDPVAHGRALDRV
jgi:hypothetical protein